MIPDNAANDDHPQTIKAEPDARGSALFRHPPHPPHDEPLREEASPLGLGQQALGRRPEQERHDLPAGETIGDAIGSGPGIAVGSGIGPDRGELGGGDPPEAAESAEPLGTYRPGESRD